MNLALVEVARNSNNVMDDKPLDELAPYLDHTALQVGITLPEIEVISQKSVELGMGGICIPPYFVGAVHKFTADTTTNLVSVVGFPFGYTNIISKAEATKKVLQEGADEIDLVMNLSAFLNGNYEHVGDELESIHTLCHMQNKKLKVIIETCLLSPDQLLKACEICAEKEVDFIKTSTGFNGPGATLADIKKMRSVLPANIKIKASGGIKTADQVREFISAGADRIGTSQGINILEP